MQRAGSSDKCLSDVLPATVTHVYGLWSKMSVRVCAEKQTAAVVRCSRGQPKAGRGLQQKVELNARAGAGAGGGRNNHKQDCSTQPSTETEGERNIRRTRCTQAPGAQVGRQQAGVGVGVGGGGGFFFLLEGEGGLTSGTQSLDRRLEGLIPTAGRSSRQAGGGSKQECCGLIASRKRPCSESGSGHSNGEVTTASLAGRQQQQQHRATEAASRES